MIPSSLQEFIDLYISKIAELEKEYHKGVIEGKAFAELKLIKDHIIFLKSENRLRDKAIFRKSLS